MLLLEKDFIFYFVVFTSLVFPQTNFSSSEKKEINQ